MQSGAARGDVGIVPLHRHRLEDAGQGRGLAQQQGPGGIGEVQDPEPGPDAGVDQIALDVQGNRGAA